MPISEPGIYNLHPADYHKDPVAEPSLSSSGIKTLLCGSPAQFAAQHWRLTKWREELENKQATKAMEAGSIAHAILLGKGARYIEAHPNDFKNKDGSPSQTWGSGEAKQFKAEQKAIGNIILNRGGKRSAGIEASVGSMRDLIAAEYGDFPLGESEQTLIWQAETSHGMIWCRAMLDHLSLRHMLILDPKFTDLAIDDRSIQRKAASERWHIQQEFYTEGVEQTHAQHDLRGRLTFRFVVGELNPPYQTRFVDLPESWSHVARTQIDRAANQFALCLKNNSWPALPKAFSPNPPEWMMREFEEEEIIQEGEGF